MFERARLIGSPEKTIVVQTRKGTSISNAQAPIPDDASRRTYRLLRRQNRTWQSRKPATGIYNCYGHVWTARRTAIYNIDQIDVILREDGYRQLNESQTPMEGDLALYRNNRLGIIHAGEVVRVLSAGSLISWSILSKWNDTSGEDIHKPEAVPNSYEPYQLEYWTDRI